ncbi:uncharacterized protein IUM83_09457 [Phytophthora cinnamomi]|uniref:uncharacterized protein n=1 Tax=Phytophthora cinnamomi TaxID=4785 RepID=UPI0035597B09|nr:hypothetical protein IUM83_09457 [Phytophthora cinnamomi]
MDPLQHLVAPRRPLPSPRSKAGDGVSRNVFALPVIHQFEPVLASSPKSYMVAGAAKRKKSGGGSNAAAVGAGSPPVVPSQPQRPRSKDGVDSPRVLRPQPPTGISSRADVDIYRYSQRTEQRMAIRPLFEQRRGSEGDARPPSTKRKVKRGVKRGEAVSGGEETGVGDQIEVDDGDRDLETRMKPEGEEDTHMGSEEEVGAMQGVLVQAYVENGIISTLRHFQQQEAIHLNVAAFMQQAASIDSDAAFKERVHQNLEAVKMTKLKEIAITSIVDDMILDFIAFRCRVEIHAAKYSGGYDDHYASKLQAAYRMSAQKKSCRATWEADIHARQEQQRMLDTFSVDELAQHCLDLLISCVKDWGIDPDPLFEALNLCGRHCHGKLAIRIVEEKFNEFAASE